VSRRRPARQSTNRAFATLGAVLRELRLERGLTQVEVAEKSGVSKSMMSLYEGGRQQPQLDTLERLLGVFDVGVKELGARLEKEPDERRDPRRRRGPWGRGENPPPSGAFPSETAEAVGDVLRGIADLIQCALDRELPASEAADEVPPEPPEGGADDAGNR
jgi:transcriptional regulator with XRE-family HTH domain